jgi:hypothetical protein
MAAVGEDDLEFDDVRDGAAVADGVVAACVVADHAAKRGAAVRRGVWAEFQTVGPGDALQVIEHRPGLNDGAARLGIHTQHPVHVPREVDDQSGTDCVARHAGSSAAGDDRDPLVAAGLDQGDDVGGAPWVRHAKRRHPVQRCVIGELGSGARVEIGGHSELFDDVPQHCSTVGQYS